MLFLKVSKIFLMQKIAILFFLYGSTVLCQQQDPVLKIEGLSHPESVIYDEKKETYYVSNMAGRVSGDGFISRISKNDNIQDLSWISGLNDPKGLLIKGNSLFVTDVTELVEIDIESGKIIERIPVDGARSLNDPALDDKGNIYFSDLAKGSIYVLKPSGEIEEWLNSPELENPNGLLVTDKHILVSAWGKDNSGNFLKIDRRTKEIEKISRDGIGNLDGVQEIENGKYYISDWGSGKIYSIDLSGNLQEILTSAKSSGDILYRSKEKKLYVPMNHQNELWIYKMN